MRGRIKGHQLAADAQRQEEMCVRNRLVKLRRFRSDACWQRAVIGQQIGQRVKGCGLTAKQRVQRRNERIYPLLRTRLGRCVRRIRKQPVRQRPVRGGEPAALGRSAVVRQRGRKQLRRLREQAAAVKFRMFKAGCKLRRHAVSERFGRKSHGRRSFSRFWGSSD